MGIIDPASEPINGDGLSLLKDGPIFGNVFWSRFCSVVVVGAAVAVFLMPSFSAMKVHRWWARE